MTQYNVLTSDQNKCVLNMDEVISLSQIFTWAMMYYMVSSSSEREGIFFGL